MTPREQGVSDARTFAAECPLQARSMTPGQPDADEALISALGVEATAKLFGVAPGTDNFSVACREYSDAFAGELRIIQEEG